VQYLNRAYTKIPFYSGERNDDLATSALDAMTKDLDNNTSYGAFGDRNLRGLKHDVDYERSHGSKDWYNYDNVYQFVFDQEKKGLLNPKETDRKAKIAKRI
jgi:hypothetical protein